MTLDIVLVNIGAVAVIAWIVWFFWLSEKKTTAATAGSTGAQEAYIRVQGGYDPDVIVVQAGRPVRLHFQRKETAACSEMVEFPDFGISEMLPSGKTVTIEITPEPGEYPFACQMGMLRGRLVARGNGGVA